MSYDERRKRAVLFGGYSTLSDAPASETWEYDGTVWLERVVDRATAMTFGAYGPQQSMTYDAARGVSLFLGQLVEFERGPSPLGAAGSETLVFDGSRWQSVAHNATFVSRTSYGITYDSARERAIVFGGTADDGRGALGDTWEWDGSGWEQRTSAASPQPRAQHALAYDVARQRTVLFGGEPQRQNGASGLLNDTWEWDGDAWTELHPGASPPPRTRHALVYDQARRRTVLFGGAARADGQEGGALGDTWEWDGVTWTQQTAVVSPRARAGHVMVYDSTRKRVLLFGGDDNGSFGDEEAQFANLWEWDGSTWVEVAVDPFPSARQNPSLAFDPDRQHVVMFGGLSYNSPQDPFGDTWVWDGDRWSQRRISPAPTPRSSAAFGSDPDSRTLLLYGGMDGVAGLSDTWAWDGTTWSQKLGARAAADVQPGMMYDAASARLILVADGQTFSWQNESWQALSGVAHLDNLLGIGALSYDRGRSRGLLLAIQETPDRVGEFAYEWDGLGWRSLDGWSAPNVIEGGLAYDTHRRGLLRVDYSNADQYNTLCAVEGTALRPLAAPGNPAVANPAIVYDEERRQLLLVGNQFGDSANAAIQTWLWSELEPAQEIVVDLKPLFGTSRRHDVSVDGLAFRAVTGATAAFGGALASGAALEIWTGSAFVRAQRNEATFDSPGALCFESADPATLGGLEVDKQWPFLLRAAADADGPEPAQLRTSAFEVRARFHIGNAAPALPQAKHSFGKTCDPGGWAMRDLPAGG
jgi:hypothetical protein